MTTPAQHVGRNILHHARQTADHRMTPDRAELMDGRAAPDDCIILQMHIAGQLDAVGANDMVAHDDAMCGMTVAHEQAVTADDRLFAV